MYHKCFMITQILPKCGVYEIIYKRNSNAITTLQKLYIATIYRYVCTGYAKHKV